VIGCGTTLTVVSRRPCHAAAVTAAIATGDPAASGLTRRAVLTLPVLAGVAVLAGCTDGDSQSTVKPTASDSTALHPELDEALTRELALLDWAGALALVEAQQVLSTHVDALREGGALGALDGEPAQGRGRLRRFVEALDAAADQTQRTVTEPESGSDAALLATIAASDAALAASLRGSRG